ncbi:putative ABC transport system permease protein [Desulfotomaculum arcticum]|uniref:Putative ABC transport system permease protein n=1 Tax=Desulfotruncus arcticus DSM 17038 TaxID=1121424 RepID=A0A1I2MUP6_9FIRM|nr:ABC transporter permease [Desulfotruncus arcticus]SFF93056.1 putative ABC transport system permease protein [Desulfotomaculum arcticum] [Desulfotruncus arcticus DSM 17038]
MKLKQLIKLVLTNIYQNKMRTFLTTLGVIVGTVTIFLVVAIGAGGEAQVNEQYSRLNVGTIIVMAAQRGRVVDPLTAQDAQLFAESENIGQAYPVLQGNGDINYDNYSTRGSFVAILPDFQQNSHLTIQEGRMLEEEDETKKNKCVVVGAELANTLTDGNPSEIVGQNISINGRKFEVVGIYNRVGDAGPGMSYDDSAFITYTVGQKYLLGTRANPMIMAQATGLDTVQAAISDITNILDANHRVGGADQFRIVDAGSRLAAAQESARTMSLLLLAVAVVVLIVSGIGIMNVMFVTVKERTKEIGTLKAIGAKKREILSQFLLEAVVISLVGGVLGVIIGFFTVPLLKYFELPAIPTLNGILLGLIFSMVTGVFFGFYPALKAAELNPIEALRYE